MEEHTGNRLARAMKAAGVSNTDLADAAGVSLQAVGKWLKTGNIARARLPAVTARLGITADELLGTASGVSEPPPGDGLPYGKYVFVPRYRVALQNGDGAHDRFDEVDDEIAFRREFIRRNGWELDALTVVYARGESMAPRIQPKDVLLVDTRERARKIEDGVVYAFRYGDDERVKRLRWRYDGALVVQSDNPDPRYREEVVPASDLGQIHIIGRVVWSGGSM